MRITVGSRLQLTEVPEGVRTVLERALTIKNPAYARAVKYSPYAHVAVPQHLFCFDGVRSGSINLPRGFDWRSMPPDVALYFEKASWLDARLGCPVKWPSIDRLDLDATQRSTLEAFQDNVLDSLQGTGLVVLPVASGKTRTALALAALSGQRTLVLCKTGPIAKAWVSEIAKVYKGDVAPGTVRQTLWEHGNLITIASWQTLNRHAEEWDTMFQHYGMLVVDECHTSPAPVFSRFVNAFPGRYKVGLTGTPKRSDGLDAIIPFQFGAPLLPPAAEHGARVMSVTDVITVKTMFTYEPTKLGRVFNFAEYESFATEDGARNRLIVNNVFAEYTKKNFCLVTTKRREHAKQLHASISKLVGEGNAVLLLGGAGFASVDATIEELNACKKPYVIVATVSLLSEGANIPALNRLFLASSIKEPLLLEQVIGRVQRKAPGKKDVLVYDFVDWSVGVVRRHYTRYRVPVYQRIGVKKFANMFYA